jgi:hypothetical protein
VVDPPGPYLPDKLSHRVGVAKFDIVKDDSVDDPLNVFQGTAPPADTVNLHLPQGEKVLCQMTARETGNARDEYPHEYVLSLCLLVSPLAKSPVIVLEFLFMSMSATGR